MSQNRQPEGQPSGGQFAETSRAASGLTLAPPPSDESLPVLSDHDAQVLAEVDLEFHVADIAWAQANREMDADADSTEDPMYDAEGPWHGEGESFEAAEGLPARRAA